jgi:uncharacterized protein (TIGR02118 family)
MIRFLITYDTPTDPTAFDRHYQDVHVPLTRQLPGLIDYTVVRDPQQVRGAAYYQIAELTWPDWETVRAAFASGPGHGSRHGQP